ncbi:MAG: hypothetical protein ACRYFS_25255 [Janthinobacterium lividum]
MKEFLRAAFCIFALFVAAFWPLLLILATSAGMSVTGTTLGMSVSNSPLNWKEAFAVGAAWNAAYFLVGYGIVRKGLAKSDETDA